MGQPKELALPSVNENSWQVRAAAEKSYSRGPATDKSAAFRKMGSQRGDNPCCGLTVTVR